MNPILQALMGRAGIHFMGVNADFQAEGAAWAFATRKTVSPAMHSRP